MHVWMGCDDLAHTLKRTLQWIRRRLKIHFKDFKVDINVAIIQYFVSRKSLVRHTLNNLSCMPEHICEGDLYSRQLSELQLERKTQVKVHLQKQTLEASN